MGRWGAVCFCVLAWLAAVTVSGMAATFTPTVNVRLGYSDNVRFTQDARGDAFLSVEPGFRYQTGDPANLFSANGFVTLTEYFRIKDLSQFEGGQLSVAFQKQFSPIFDVTIRDTLAATYDAPILDSGGNLVRLKTENSRRDSNTFSVDMHYRYARDSNFNAGYAWTVTRYNEKEDEGSNSDVQQVRAGLTHRWSAHWRSEVKAGASRTEYEEIAPEERYNLSLRVVRMMGPSLDVFAGVGYSHVKTASTTADQDDDTSTYEIYDVSAGFSYKINPHFSFGLSAGFSETRGDQVADDAGQTYPTFEAWLRYSQQVWSLYISARSTLDDENLIGENVGLTRTQSLTVAYNYRWTKRLDFQLAASVVQNDTKNDTLAGGFDPDFQGDVVYYRATARAKYALTRHQSLSLDYTYYEADNDDASQSRRENRIVLMYSWQSPYRW